MRNAITKLTPRESEVMAILYAYPSCTASESGTLLGVSRQCVHIHCSRIYSKFGNALSQPEGVTAQFSILNDLALIRDACNATLITPTTKILFGAARLELILLSWFFGTRGDSESGWLKE